ncbi:hypothetical protein CHUAL_008572 [Chamberlinius hualienensis]
MSEMETVVVVAIAVLATVFVGSLIALILVCRHRYCHRPDFLTQQMADTRPDIHLINGRDDINDVELDDVCLHPDIERILDDDQWIDDATGLIPHCLTILKICHQLTERLVAMTMGNVQHQPQKRLWDIIEVAKRISPRVDDVVRSMYPPLDPRLLEARTTALVLSVTHLTLVTRSVCQVTIFDWIQESLQEMEEHLKVLRDAALAMDDGCKSIASNDSQTAFGVGNIVNEFS